MGVLSNSAMSFILLYSLIGPGSTSASFSMPNTKAWATRYRSLSEKNPDVIEEPKLSVGTGVLLIK